MNPAGGILTGTVELAEEVTDGTKPFPVELNVTWTDYGLASTMGFADSYPGLGTIAGVGILRFAHVAGTISDGYNTASGPSTSNAWVVLSSHIAMLNYTAAKQH